MEIIGLIGIKRNGLSYIYIFLTIDQQEGVSQSYYSKICNKL